MKKVLITGSKGFLGRHVVKRLKDDYELLTPSSSELNVGDIDDLHDYISSNGPSVIIHLAAVCGGIGANQESPADFFMENSLMSLNILSASSYYNIEKLVTLGSVCSYPKFTPVPFKEEDLWNGYPEETNAPYGIAKKNLLVGCQAYHQQYGRNFIHLIPVNMYGEYDNFNPNSSHVIPALLKKFIEAKESGDRSVEVWGDGSASREFLYAGDCAEAIHLALEGYDSPEPVNIGTGKEISIKDLVDIIVQCVGFKGKVVFDTNKPEGQFRKPADNTKLLTLFPEFKFTSVEDGLKETVNWFVENYERARR